MDKFDKILRDKLASHDAGMDSGAWEQFAQRFDKVQGFENAIRTKLYNHDAGMTNGAWEQFEQRLNQPATSNWVNYLTAGIAAVLVGVGVYYFSGETTTVNNTTKPVATEATLAHNTVKGNSVTTNNHVVTNNNGVAANNNHANNIANNNVNNSIGVNNNGNNAVVNNNNGNNNVVNHANNNTTNNVVNTNVVNNNSNNVANNTLNNKVNDNNNNATNNVANNNANNLNNGSAMVAPEFSGLVSEICQNDHIILKATNIKPGYTVSWLLNGEEISGDASMKLSMNNAGAQTVQLVYAATENGKTVTAASEKATINVLALPRADFEVIDAESATYPEHTFKRTEGKDLTAMWNFGDNSFSTDEVGTHVYKKKGTYTASLTVTGNNGCQAKISDKVNIAEDYNLLAPNAFSPNGDGGNDNFIPKALLAMPDCNFKMTIYDRTGKQVYQTSRIDAPWDGNDATTGARYTTETVFVWKVQLMLPGKPKEEYMGHVTLLSK